MKSEFLLAFNEICQARGLPRDTVLDALKTALVSAYRRNTNSSTNQEVVVEIDQHTGDPTILVEKEVVDSIIDNRTEVTITAARKAGYVDAEMGQMVMMDNTPPHFGRIAAQTAKQVILQRVREAEREQLFEDFSAREGEIVNGTVQSVSGQHITVGLGRTEALLPKSQQVKSERYRAHDKIRVYVLEVRRTNRGPQIIVSRSHRNLLRRLLELEVPEIYNGQVDIKSIAREAGARSKVAVIALQPGVDPVGACVGMRGVRIQSIVRELNDEKIDVIEYNPDQKIFIAKALSPARVAHVFLEDHPENGKTATVIVPDDQLSLAIGREGQNARLAAKLTGWRIDIKSLTEAGRDSLQLLDQPAADQKVANDADTLDQVKLVLAKKDANRPITAEDYNLLGRFVMAIEGNIVASRAVEFDQIRVVYHEVKQTIPDATWQVPITTLDLPAEIDSLLEEHNIESLGDILFHVKLGEAHLMAMEGFNHETIEYLQQLAQDQTLIQEVEAEDEQDVELAEEVVFVSDEALEEPAEEGLIVEEMEEDDEEDDEEEEDDLSQLQIAPELLEDIDNLNKPLITPVEEEEEEEEKTIKPVVIIKPTEPDKEEKPPKRRKRKGKQLVYDEDMGEVVVRRTRKRGRQANEWEDFEDFDF